MILELSTTDDYEVNFNPSPKDEIKQNILSILKTMQGSVPLFRDFGFPHDAIDKPSHLVQALISKDLITQIEKYEPRARLLELKTEQCELNTGNLKITLKVAINDE